MAEVNSIYSIIKAPLLTEKSTGLTPYRQYVFAVDRNANVIQIKQAVEKVYKVKVAKVNTMMVKAKTKRVRWNQPGKTTPWKKAIVTLKEGFEIKLT
ncbi:MAG: 50S ribosomal protein L23 [Candidatus Omnitrophota bacterium]